MVRLHEALRPKRVRREGKYDFEGMCKLVGGITREGRECLVVLPREGEVRLELDKGIVRVTLGSEEFVAPVEGKPEFDCVSEYGKDLFSDRRGYYFVEWKKIRCVHEDERRRLSITRSGKREITAHPSVREPGKRTDFRVRYYDKAGKKVGFEISVSVPEYL